MSNQSSTFLAFRRSFTTTKINAQELNNAIIAMEAELYKMKTEKVLLTQELVLLRTKLPETKIEEFMNGSIEELLSKLNEITLTIFSSVEVALLTAGATTEYLDFVQAVEMAGTVFGMSIPVLCFIVIVKKALSTYVKPITTTFNVTFRQPLICTVSYMLTHQNEMENISENELLVLLRENIAELR